MISVSLILIFVIGLFFGSFFGVLIDRIPKRKSVAKGRSKCDFCKKELLWIDLIPVFSYLFLKGKCRYCHTKLSIFYPIIEITTGILFVLTYAFLIFNLQFTIYNLVYNLLIISALIVLFFQDLKYGFLSDRIILSGLTVSFLYFLIFQKEQLLNHLLTAIFSFSFFFLISYIFFTLTKKHGMGGGDIKLSFFLGFLLGFPGAVVCFYIAFLTGAMVAIILVLWRKKDYLKDSLPFGPFLIAAAFISLFWGNLIYIKALGLLGL